MLRRLLPLVLIAVLFGGLALLVNTKPATQLTLDEALSVIRKDGLDAAFERVRKEYKTTPEFRGNCHRFMLDMGERVFAEFPDLETAVYSPLSATCNYGFFQAYPYSLLLATKDVERAKRYCLRVGDELKEYVPSAQAECFRGIGRALPFIDEASAGDVKAMAAYALHVCDVVATLVRVSSGLESDHEMCVSGAFNMLGRAVGRGMNDLHVDSVRPFRLCELLDDPDVKLRCYGNFKWNLSASLDFSNPIKVFETAKRVDDTHAALAAIVFTIGYEHARLNLKFKDVYARTMNVCLALPEAWQMECVRGAAIGFTKHGTPSSQHEQVASFCREAQQAGVNPKECLYSQVIQYIKGFYSPSRFDVACRIFRKQLNVECEF